MSDDAQAKIEALERSMADQARLLSESAARYADRAAKAEAELAVATELLERAVHIAGHRSPRGMKWGHVGRVFGVGSTRAVELCCKFGIDPDETVGR